MVKKHTLKDFLSIKSSFCGNISFDNKYIAYLNNDSGTSQIYLYNQETENVTQLTRYDDYISNLSFSPTENKLIFLKAEGGNEQNQIYLMDIKTKKIKILFDTPKAKYIFGGWSKDGNKICYSSTERNNVDFDVYTYDLLLEEKKVITNKNGFWIPLGFSPSGKILVVALVKSSVDNDLYLYNLTTGNKRHITPHDDEVFYDRPQWLPDESGFFFKTNYKQNFLGVAFYHMDKNSYSYVLKKDCDIEEIKISEDGTLIAVVTNQDGYSICEIYKTKTFKKYSHKPFPEGVISEIRWAKDGNSLVFTFSNATHPVNVWVWDKISNLFSKVSRDDYSISHEIFSKPELIRYRSFDNLEIPTFLYSIDRKSKKNPVIIVIHGGPEEQHRPAFSALTQYFINRGYIIAAPNVRGSRGYGKHFVKLDDVDKRMDSVRDLEYLFKYLSSIPEIDRNRIILFGTSYGGFMVLAGLTTFPDLWAAGVDIVGISNFITFLKNTSPYRRRLREAEYGSLKKNKKFLEKISPINHIEKIKAPLLIIHGANDPRVPLSEAEQVKKKLEKRGIPVKLLVYEDEGHGLAKLENRLDAYTKMVKFLKSHLKTNS